MGSFKLKLVVYFLLLSLLPLAAAFWGFSSIATQSETRLADARLQAGLRAGLAAYQDDVNRAGAAATQLAKRPDFERALADRDRPALERILSTRPGLRVHAGKLTIGPAPPLAAERRVSVIGRHGSLGDVVGTVALDSRFVARLRARSGLAPQDELVLLRHGRVVAGPAAARGFVPLRPGETATVRLGRTDYRALVAGGLQERPGVSVAVLTPQGQIVAANRRAERRLLLGLVLSLLLIGLVAYLEGRTIVRTIAELVGAARAIARGNFEERVPVRGRDEFALLGSAFNEMAGQLQSRLAELEEERERLSEAIARFGEALGATLDPRSLLRIIVETAVEASGAVGGILIPSEGEAVQVGDPDSGAERLELPLVAGRFNFGTLVVVGDSFDDDQRMAAVSLTAQAVVALENARLHSIVERQALVDGLTGLANRRQVEHALGAELARAHRFGGPVALVISDLDDFKQVNDRFGHPAGDAVIKEFAAVLAETVREADVAGRWGGEEFVLILTGTDLEGGVHLAERVREALAARTMLAPDGTPLRITASFGVAAFPGSATEEELIAAADSALYEAKRTGKNRVESSAAPLPQT